MSWRTLLETYIRRCNLTEADLEYIEDLITRTLAKQRNQHAEIAWKMQMSSFGGGTAIGNAIQDTSFNYDVKD